MSVLDWIRKGKGWLTWAEKLWEEPRDPLDEDTTVVLSEEQLGYIEDRSLDASVSTRHDIHTLMSAIRRQNDKIERAVDLLSEALRGDEVHEEAVADTLHFLRSVAPLHPHANDAVSRLLRAMEKPLDTMFTEGELVDVFMAPTNPLEGVTDEPTLMQAFAALYVMNYGDDDATAHLGLYETGGPYGRYGLTSEEARAFSALQGFVGGWLRAFGAEPTRFYDAVGEEVKRVGLARATWSERLSAGEPIGTALSHQTDGKTVVSVPPMALKMSAADAETMRGKEGVTIGDTNEGVTNVYLRREPFVVVREPVMLGEAPEPKGAIYVGGKKVADVMTLEMVESRAQAAADDDCITKIDE